MPYTNNLLGGPAGFNLIVGTTQQVTDKEATHTIADFNDSFEIETGDKILFLDGTHTLTRDEDILPDDVKIYFSPQAILDDGADQTLTFSGTRIQVHDGRFTGWTNSAGEITISGDNCYFIVVQGNIDIFTIDSGAQGSMVVSVNSGIKTAQWNIDSITGNTTLELATKGLSNGYASLDGSSLVVEEPASKAQSSGIASLDASGELVQNIDGAKIQNIALANYDIVVGSSGQVSSGAATHDVSDFVAAISNGDRVFFLDGTHTLGTNENVTESDVEISSESIEAILAFSTRSFTLSGVRSSLNMRTSGAGAGDMIGSAQGVLFEITGANHTAFTLTNGAGGKVLGAQTVEVLSGSGTWTKPDDVSIIHITMCGGGGGGGGGSTTSTNGGGGGGGGGGYFSGHIPVTTNIDYVVGAGGTGGTVNNNGNDGVTSTFGSGDSQREAHWGDRGRAPTNSKGGDGFGIFVRDPTTGSGGTPGLRNGGAAGGGTPGASGGRGASSMFADGGLSGSGLSEGGGGGGGGSSLGRGGAGGADDSSGLPGFEGGGGGGGTTGVSVNSEGGNGGNGTIIISY